MSVKCRIGVDDVDSYDDLCDYVERIVAGSSTRRFYVHARKALLAGLSPAENRTVPPLKHEWAYALARDFPECEFHLNGGLKTLNDVKNVLERGPEDGGPIVGAMIGRQAHADPWGVAQRRGHHALRRGVQPERVQARLFEQVRGVRG